MYWHTKTVDRRTLIKGSLAAAAGAAAASVTASMAARASNDGLGFFSPYRKEVEDVSIASLQEQMTAGTLTAQQLTGMYLTRIRDLDQGGPMLNSIIETNPDAIPTAIQLDAERAAGNVRGPLHGIPIVLKDNIDTADQMQTTAGSLALLSSMSGQDSTTAEKLREAGAIIIGKAGLSEWANFRGFMSSSGWSGRGGQVRNPYIIDRNPCGSSAGSGTAPSASLVAAAIGTETDGSIVCPSTANGLAGIKPTVGLTSRAGVIPISHTQDTIGPMCRTMADAAVVLGALTGVDPRDPATEASAGHSYTDYTQFLDDNGLNGARIGVARQLFGFSPEADQIVNQAIAWMQELGATIIDPVELPNLEEIDNSGAEFDVLLYEFKPDLAAYLETRTPGSARDLAGLIQFNLDHADQELQFFGQEIFLLSEAKGPLTDPAYLEALAISRDGSRESLNEALDGNNLDALIAPTGSPAWPIDLINGDHFLGGSSSPAARAGYPLVTVPAGYSFGLPVGVTFMGRQWDEPTLIKLASGFEAGTLVRQAPQFIRSFTG